MRARLVVAMGITFVLAACTSGPDTPTDPSDPLVGSPVADRVLVVTDGQGERPAISVADAVARVGQDGPLLVVGSLFVDPNGDVRLCEAILESFPPQCGGARLEVRGLNLVEVPGLQDANGVRWAESVELFGHLEG